MARIGEVILGQLLSSTSALFVAPRTPIFPGFSRMVARLFANPRGPVGFQELKNTSFFQAFLVTRDYKMGRSRAKGVGLLGFLCSGERDIDKYRKLGRKIRKPFSLGVYPSRFYIPWPSDF